MPRIRTKSFNDGDCVRINFNQCTLGFSLETIFQVVDTDTYDPDVIIEAEDDHFLNFELVSAV